jgi:hypothetical protein
MADTFPLKWPFGKDRTKSWSRKESQFKTTPGRARDGLIEELRKLGAKNIVISSNVATYMRGGNEIPYADQSAANDDPGVAVYYTWNQEQYCLACDKYKTVMDNMQALMKTIDAIRGIERWGTGEMMKDAFQGFKALPAPEVKPKKWFEVLGVPENAHAFQIKEAYRGLAKIHHPDAGGSSHQFNAINQAYQDGIKKFN